MKPHHRGRLWELLNQYATNAGGHPIPEWSWSDDHPNAKLVRAIDKLIEDSEREHIEYAIDLAFKKMKARQQ